MKRALLLVVFVLAAQAAEWAPIATRVPVSWAPGTHTGVYGGIPARSNIIDLTASPYNADKTGATSAVTAIANAIYYRTPGDILYLPAGTYKIDGAISVLPDKDRITFRGDVDASGEPSTILNITTDQPISIGYSFSSGDATFTATANVTKGGTSIAVSSSAAAQVGALLSITFVDSITFPVLSAWGYEGLAGQLVRVVSVPDSTHINVFPPIVTDAAVLAIGMKAENGTAEGIGFENIRFDNTVGQAASILRFEASFDVWVKNCKFIAPTNNSISLSSVVSAEVRESWLNDGGVGSNHYGIYLGGNGGVSGSLIENNVILGTQPGIEINSKSVGNVVGYNYFLRCAKDLDSNHQPHPGWNLFEGNVLGQLQTDGYFGTNGPDTIFRNAFRPSGFGLTINRFAYDQTVAGNLFTNPASYGNPNIGNGSYSSYSRFSAGVYSVDYDSSTHKAKVLSAATLTTRTNDTTGVITLPTGGGTWFAAHDARSLNRIFGMIVGGVLRGGIVNSISGDTVNFNNSGWYSLADQGTTFDIWPSDAGFQEQDQDVFPDWHSTFSGRTQSRANYYTNKPDAANGDTGVSGIPSFESIGSDTLPDSLYRASRPSFFDGTSCSWPPIDPFSPFYAETMIPAGARYERVTNGATSFPAYRPGRRTLRR